MNKQQTFNKVVRHLRKQGAPSMSGNFCEYRSANGFKCAVGCLIPDELYDPKMEGKDVFSLKPVLDLLEIDVNLADFLQSVHDSHSPREWEFLFECVAEKFGLKVPDET